MVTETVTYMATYIYLQDLEWYALKSECWYNFNFVVSGDTGCCHSDNTQCPQWRQTRYDNSRLSMIYFSTLWGLLLTHTLSVIWASTGSCNCLSPVQRQAIKWTNAYSSSTGTLETNFSKIWIIIQANTFINVVRRTAAILFRPQYAKLRKWRLLTASYCSRSVCFYPVPLATFSPLAAIKRGLSPQIISCPDLTGN